MTVFPPELLAAADQRLAFLEENLTEIVGMAKTVLGEDATQVERAVRLRYLLRLAGGISGPGKVEELLAVAVLRLADPPACTACPECAKSSLVAALLEG
ncbi:hypothetical protein Rhe02_54160 [Rhizocola hellebori]|uniref:Uncharacterized protein n=1 Tax=Rhizocola hellebori TaxID=1392758 RepID=A0A8J3QAS8_9ACTN|nr:hypothetical protein [Rhizocola hellebori]GIH07349.1 hypothetical protein Rhe02_54160 [Rhizocola hellebori]